MAKWIDKLLFWRKRGKGQAAEVDEPVFSPGDASTPIILSAKKKAVDSPSVPLSKQPQPAQPLPSSGRIDMNTEADQHRKKIQEKINRLANQFASGLVNRKQFEELYQHYQKELHIIEQFTSEETSSDEDWQKAFQEGKSVVIRKQHSARLAGFSIYERLSGMPLKTCGSFGVDPSLFVPMLFAYQSATREILGSSLQSTKVENGQWLCFARGEYSTTVALFTTEPSGKQLAKLEELQKLFESANREKLNRTPVNPDDLVVPHEFFLTHPF